MNETQEADALAALLDGTLDPADAPSHLRGLAELAGRVSDTTVLVDPTPAFREALRGDLLNAVGAQAAGGAATAAATAATTATPLQAIAAAIAAATVLAGSGIAIAAPAAAPGDALYGPKRLIETGQLLVAGDDRDAALLLDFATTRVDETLGLVDTAVVLGLLDESQRHIDDALALLDGLTPRVADQLLRDFTARHGAALQTLLATTEDVTVGLRADQLLDETRALSARVTTDAPTDAATSGGDDDGTDGDPAPVGTAPDDRVDAPDSDDGSSSGDTDTVTGTTDDVDDTVDDITDGLDDTVDDVTDGLDDAVDDITDGLDDTVDDVTDGLDATTQDATDLLEDSAGLP